MKFPFINICLPAWAAATRTWVLLSQSRLAPSQRLLWLLFEGGVWVVKNALEQGKGRSVPVLAGPSMGSRHSLDSYVEGNELPDTAENPERPLLTCQGWRPARPGGESHLHLQVPCRICPIMATQTWVHLTSKHSGEHMVLSEHKPRHDHKRSCCCFLGWPGAERKTKNGEITRIVHRSF